MNGQTIFSLSNTPAAALTSLGGTASGGTADAFAPLLAQAVLGGGSSPNLTEAVLPQKAQDALLSQGKLVPFWPNSLAVKGEQNNDKTIKTEEKVSTSQETIGEEAAALVQAIQQLLVQLSSEDQSALKSKVDDLAQAVEVIAGTSELKQQLSPKQILELQGLMQGLTEGREAGESSFKLPQLTNKDAQSPNLKSFDLRFPETVEGTTEEGSTIHIIQKLKSLLREQTSGSPLEQVQASPNPQETAQLTSPGSNQPSMDLIMPLTPTESRVQVLAQPPLEKVQPLPAALKENVFEQVVRSMNFSIKEGQSEMQIHLKPDFLGHMSMKIAVEDGLVAASFTVENHQVKELLESSLANLRQSLTNQGLKVDTLTVSIGSGGAFSDLSQRQSNWAAPTFKRNNSEEYRDVETEIAPVSYEKGPGWTSSMDYIV